jgi:hypothetical protein
MPKRSAIVLSEERYVEIARTLLGDAYAADLSDKSQRRHKFGSKELKVNNKIFGMLVKGKLVVKLPRRRVDELVAAENGDRFKLGQERVMKEWLVVEPKSEDDWLPLAKEAMEFVSSRG